MALLRPPMCAFAHLLAICLDAVCLTGFCTESTSSRQTGVLVGGGLAGGGWTCGTLPQDGGGAPQPPDAVQRRAMELWWCTTRVLHPCGVALLARAWVSSCVWGRRSGPSEYGSARSDPWIRPMHAVAARGDENAVRFNCILIVCRSGYAVVSGTYFYRLPYLQRVPHQSNY